MNHATRRKLPWAALLALTGVLPNGSLPSLVRDDYFANEIWRPLLPFGSGSNLEKPRIIYELAADSTDIRAISARVSTAKWRRASGLQAARPYARRALLPFRALQPQPT